MRLVAEVDASFQELTHRELGQSHGPASPLSG
jgi:hypothetical protein